MTTEAVRRNAVLIALLALLAGAVAWSQEPPSPSDLIARLLTRLTSLELELAEVRKEAEAVKNALDNPKPPPDPPAPTTIHVPAGGDLQAALDKVQAAGTVTLEAGATYRGSFNVNKSLTLITIGWAHTGQVNPDMAPRMAHIQSSDIVEAALEIAPGSADVPAPTNVTVRGIRLSGPSNEIVQCGRGDHRQTTLEQQPRGVTFDQLYIHGDPTAGAKRAIALNCADARVTNSYIADIRRVGQDSQAIAGYNGAGPFLIEDNYLEAASENILFGGADPAIPGLIPCDMKIRRNLLTKRLEWRTQSLNVKTGIEFKAGCRVEFTDNVIENVWLAAQVGWAVTLTPSQYGSNPNVQISDVTIQRNHIRNVGGGMNILGHSQHSDRPSLRTERLIITDNWWQIDHLKWGGVGALIQINRGPADIAIEYNTVEQTGSRVISGDGPPVTGWRFVGNLIRSAGRYGIFVRAADGENYPYGNRWRDYFPGGVIERNAIADFPRPSNLPGNLHLTAAQAEIVDGYGVGMAAGYGRRRNP